MDQKQKQKFRASKEWKQFRDKIRHEQVNDPITGARLTRLANLHHLCLDETKYTDLSNEDNFVFLNPFSHKVVHFIFGKHGKDWRKRIEKLIEICERMEALNE